MSDTRLRLRGWWQRALRFLDSTPPAAPTQILTDLPLRPPPDRHEVDPGRPMWTVDALVDVKPGSGGRRWKPDVVHTRLMPAIRPDAETRPGWPK